jgi:hypothetical protein
MRYTIKINCGNAAFYNPEDDHDPAAEVASILERLALHLRDGNVGATNLHDTNGNVVGYAQFDSNDVCK